ncbi:hypothetical protein AAHE18_05G074800 [Arachis hypogaea]
MGFQFNSFSLLDLLLSLSALRSCCINSREKEKTDTKQANNLTRAQSHSTANAAMPFCPSLSLCKLMTLSPNRVYEPFLSLLNFCIWVVLVLNTCHFCVCRQWLS